MYSLGKKWFQAHSVAALCGTLLLGIAHAAPPRAVKAPAVEEGQIIQIGEGGGGPVFGIEGQAVKLSDYWLGVQAVPVDPVVRAQLKLDHGLAVVHVAKEGPASKAGLKEHDILLEFGGVKLQELGQLVEALDKNKEQTAEVKLLREGKELTLKITPAKRDANAAPVEGAPLPGGAAAPAEVQRWFQKMQRGEGHEPLRMFFARPGMVLPGGEAKKFPSNLSISVQKQGDKPAQIKVQQGDKTWEVTEDKIDELPEDVRPFVKQFLGKQFDFDVQVEGFGAPGIRVEKFFGGDGAGLPEKLDAQFRELHHMIDRLQQQFHGQGGTEPMRKELEELRQQLKERRGERKEKGPKSEEPKSESKTESKT